LTDPRQNMNKRMPGRLSVPGASESTRGPRDVLREIRHVLVQRRDPEHPYPDLGKFDPRRSLLEGNGFGPIAI
jgi:hypothetical protein